MVDKVGQTPIRQSLPFWHRENAMTVDISTLLNKEQHFSKMLFAME
jgi:hypothetical protein